MTKSSTRELGLKPIIIVLVIALAMGASTVGTKLAFAAIGTNDYPPNLASAAQDSTVDPWGFSTASALHL